MFLRTHSLYAFSASNETVNSPENRVLGSVKFKVAFCQTVKVYALTSVTRLMDSSPQTTSLRCLHPSAVLSGHGVMVFPLKYILKIPGSEVLT